MENNQDEIKLLEWNEHVRLRVPMYFGGTENPDVALREIVDNAIDESYADKNCNQIFINTSFYGWNIVADNGRGIPIKLDKDHGVTKTELALANLHAGSKFVGGTGSTSIGMNGVGASCTNATSTDFIVLSRITKDNFNTSIPAVKDMWESRGPRSRKNLFYFMYCNKGLKSSEGAIELSDASNWLTGHNDALPEGYSTYVLFKPDPEIFESVKTKAPLKNLQYFKLIQRKFYNKDISIIVNDEYIEYKDISYKYELNKVIIPADTSKNKVVSFYMTFEVDPNLGSRETEGSVNSLIVDQGHHIQIAEVCYKDALVQKYGLSHNYIFNGLKLFVIVLAEELQFDSQSKVRLKSITKVKASDFSEVTKEIIKIFNKDEDYWQAHVNRLNAYAESMSNISTIDKIKNDLMSSMKGNSTKEKMSLPEKLSDATCGRSERLNAELFLCFTGDTKVKMTDGNEYRFDELANINDYSNLYTYSIDENGNKIKTRIIKAFKQPKLKKMLVRVTLNNKRYFTCTADHRILVNLGKYTAAEALKVGMKLINDEGSSYYITKLELLEYPKGIPVYDLEVENENHNFTLAAGIFVHNCEGASAAGSLKSGRKNSLYHGVYALRGRTLNTINKTVDQMMDSKELNGIFKSIGLGLDSFNVIHAEERSLGRPLTEEERNEVVRKYARYGKICIACDADLI